MISDFRKITDDIRPNAGRIYDYFIGGNFNFEVDRRVADEILKYAPHMPEYLKTIRWFLIEAINRLCEQGYDKFIDFASGLPTMDHIHQVTPVGTKIIYSDIDEETVKMSRQLIGSNPDVRYVHCAAGHPEDLLSSEETEELFGNDRKVVIGMNGIVFFLSDEEVAHSFQVLYDWANEGSKLFFCNNVVDEDVSKYKQDMIKVLELYKSMKQEIFLRPLKKTIELIKPWKIEEPGFLPLEKWLDMDTNVSKETLKNWGGADQYGVFLYK